MDSYKIALVGVSGVGKTSLMKRLVDQTYTDTYTPTQTGAGYKLSYSTFSFRVSEIPGNIQSPKVRNSYYTSDFQGIIAVFDLTNKQSYVYANTVVNELFKKIENRIPVVWVGNKCDSRTKHHFDTKNFIETSARKNCSCTKPFDTLYTIISNKKTLPGVEMMTK